MKERLYLFLGLFFVTIPVFADPTGGAATAALISAGVSALSSIFGGVSAGRARRQAERRERAAAANRMALEANRVDPPDFGADFENPAANLQVATQANVMAAEQADISLASTLDTLRATGASAGGATALARAAAQSKRGVSAQIEQQEARNAQLRAQGELQAAKIRQDAEKLQYQATVARENQALNRAASLESSASQQAAAYGAQSSQMIGQAAGAVGSVVAGGVLGEGDTFMERFKSVYDNKQEDNTQNDYTPPMFTNINPNANTNQNNNIFMPSYSTGSSYLNNNRPLGNYFPKFQYNTSNIPRLGDPGYLQWLFSQPSTNND